MLISAPTTRARALTLALCAALASGCWLAGCASAPGNVGRAAQAGGATGGAGGSVDKVAEHVARLKKKLPPGEFTVVVEPPFVVVGDGPADAVREHASGTVGWAVARLKKDFFPKDPPDIIDVWLFKDAASYRKHAREMFGDDPDTPYGYYSRQHKALIMNIETGGGTLVHEIVHPFVEANFPGCPPWLNEGLGSLFEACGDVDGHIRGFTNWRLPGLQDSIRARRVAPFKTLLAMDARTFYGDRTGTNYAQARYLCYYLQEKGLLVKFYREFTAARGADPTGFVTLQRVLGERDMAAFQRRWESYVLGLSEEFRLTPAP
jgi:hypothetical protein